MPGRSQIRSPRLSAVPALMLAAFALTSCSGVNDWLKKNSWPRFEGTPAEAQENAGAAAEKTAAKAPEQEMTRPPDALAGLPPVEMKQDGMMGSFGFNLETYFARDIKDPIERSRRLESAMVALHRDLQAMMPALQRLVESENRAAAMPAPVGAPQPLYPDEGAVEATPPPAAGAPQTPVSPGPAYADGGPAVTGLRVGDHPGKVRIVFDVSGKTSYRADLDNNEQILVVEIPDARWAAPLSSESFGRMPVLKSYRVESLEGGRGSMAVVQLRQGTQIVAQGKHPALSGPGERIVIDLGK